MTKHSSLNQYLQKYSVSDHWNMVAGNTRNISQVVVIPAYAERDMLFSTLASLALNPPSSLDYSFVLCVVNNKKNSSYEDKENNQQTLEYLQALVKRRILKKLNLDPKLKEKLHDIADSGLRLGFIDASTAGCEIPDNEGGVGMARKIGMDTALKLLLMESLSEKPILSLDADTFVQNNYLPTIKNYFKNKVKTAVIAYEHQEPADDEGRAAIYCYEIFLRYWMLGLKYAKSPFAFHSIGSTIICSTDAYLAVRGMNRREAGEDFYFLNKLAKVGNIDYIRNTCVYPSARSSLRVPFGTGKRIHRFLNHQCEEYVLPDPLIFRILEDWLLLMKQSFQYDATDILKNAGSIHPGLASFLTEFNFEQIWNKICRNTKKEHNLVNQFHRWFDGFKTLKLINTLSREFFPPINMFAALKQILKMNKMDVPEFMQAADYSKLEEQKKIVKYLREIT